MPSTTLKSKGSHGCPRLAVPMSERQQLALLMQMSSVDQQGVEGGSVSPRSPSGSNPSPRSRNRNERGETPLHVAAIKGDQTQVRKLLVERGADPNATDFAGWTPLHEACNRGWYEVAKVLLEAGATVNACGYDDITPLHDAAVNGHAKLVRLLVSSGADVTQRNKWGKTPRDDAAPGLDTQLFQDLEDIEEDEEVLSLASQH